MNLAEYIPVTHDNDFWTADIPLFVSKFPSYHNKPRMVQGKIHLSEEHFYNSLVSEVIPLSRKEGKRNYILLQPYVLEPQMFFRVGMYPKPKHYADQPETIGKVISSEVKGMRQHELGNAQAWYYPQERLIVLWECFLEASLCTYPLADDPHMPKLWKALEQWLSKQFPDATRIATPFHDPIAKSIEEYQTFLRSLGYTPIAKAAFGKEISDR